MAPLSGPRPGGAARPLDGRGAWLAGVLVALVVNLPVLQGWWADRRLAADGVPVRAEVVETALLGSGEDARPVVAFAMPRTVDEQRSQWAVEVDRATYERVEESRLIDLRVLPGRPAVFEAEGAVRSPVGLVLTVVVDLVLLGLLVVALRRRRAALAAGGPAPTRERDGWGGPDDPGGDRAGDGHPVDGPAEEEQRRRDAARDHPAGRGPRRRRSGDPGLPGGLRLGDRDVARLVAEADLRPQGPGPAWQPHPDGSLELRGALLGIRDDDVLLDVDGRPVLVVLAGHRVGALRLGDGVQVRVRARA